MKLVLLTSAAAMLIALPVLAQPQTPVAPVKTARAPETRSDVQARAQRMFARLDTNKDGFITQAESDAVRAQRAAKRQDRARHRGPAKMFDRLDANKDGSLTRAEAEAGRKTHQGAKADEPEHAQAAALGKMFDRLDTNRDGKITKAELDASMRGRSVDKGLREGRHADVLAKADANKDGRVSLAEAQQLSLQRFDAADLNRDGKITPEERKQARQQMRAHRKPG